MNTNHETEFTTCACGNCTSAPGINPNESCCFCNGSCSLADFNFNKNEADENFEVIGAINRANNYKYLALIVGDEAMGVMFEKVPFEGASTAVEAREALRQLVEKEGWERMSEEEIREASNLLF